MSTIPRNPEGPSDAVIGRRAGARRLPLAFGLLCRLGRDQRGVIATVFAVMFPVVVAILGLGIEVGIWYSVKRHNQAIADVSAYSGALELVAGGTTAQAIAAAKADASTNGFDFTQTVNAGSVVNVPCSNSTGFSGCNIPNATNACVQAVLKHQQTPLMVSYFLGNNTFPIVNCAIASVLSQTACLSGVGGGSGTSIKMGGHGSIDWPGCAITSNSTGANSIDLGGGSSITAYTIYTAGGISSGSNLTLTVPPTTHSTAPCDPYDDTAGKCGGTVVTPPAMPTMPASVTTFPTLATPPSMPAAHVVSAPAAPVSQTGTGTCAPASGAGSTAFLYTTFCYNTTSPITIGATGTLTTGHVYSFKGPVTIAAGVTVTFANNARISLNSVGAANLTINGTASVLAVTSAASPSSIFVANGSILSASSSTVTFTGGSPSAYSFKATGGFALGGNTIFGPADYAFYTGSLALNGCTVFKPGTATLDVANGNLTTGSGGVYFNPNGLACGTSYTSAASTYALQGTGFTIGGTSTDIASFGPANYGFNTGAVTINGTATFQPGSTNFNIAAGGLMTAANSTLTFCGGSAVGSCANSATSAYALSASSYTLGGTATFGSSAGSGKGYGLYGGGLTVNSGSNVGFRAPVNVYLDAGSLAINGCAAFQGGTSTIKVNAGNLTEAATGSMTFNANGTVCGTAYTSATSQYNIDTEGNGHGVTLSGPATFGAGTYYLMNANNNGTGLALNGGTAGSPTALGAGTYSIQHGGLSIGAAGTATVASDTTSTYIYEPNGTFSNAGKVTFAAGTIYFYDGSGGFTSSGAASGAFTFTGGNDSGGNPSTYYFFNGRTNGALNIASNANAAFGPATYYIINGDLVFNSGSTLTCPGCVVSTSGGAGGLGDTFVLTQTATGGTVGTVQITNPITASLDAPGTGTYAGLLVFQDRNAALGALHQGNTAQCASGPNTNHFSGGSGMNFTGGLYLPQACVEFTGGNSSANCLVLMANITVLGANSTLTGSGCSAAGVQTLSVKSAALTQ